MKYTIEDMRKRIAELSLGRGRITVMEVCGTHTASIQKYGIRALLPDNIRLVSGPGCPVCVTAQRDIAAALSLAQKDNVIFTCFGDMMRVPCGDESLYSLYESGRDIRIVLSPMDALKIAESNPDRQVVYFGIGFETTAPLTAALVEAACLRKQNNLSVLCAHKTMPEAIRKLLKNGSSIDALLCPGHVAAVIGANAFSFVPDKLGIPAVVAGFEAYDIIAALLCIAGLLARGENKCVNMYPRAVTAEGSAKAKALMREVFEPCGALWRGLGEIEDSGLRLKGRYAEFDAARRFDIRVSEVREPKGCICAGILRGQNIPTDCVNFGRLCTPESPLGACMVSSEGSCAAYYRYERGI